MEVDRLLVEQLKDLYRDAIRIDTADKTLPENKSFSHFLEDPSAFFSEETEGESLRQTLEKTWELDSITHALSELWARKWLRTRATPSELDLSQIALFNSDFTGVDFREAKVTAGTAFYGFCKVTKDKLPNDLEDNCHK